MCYPALVPKYISKEAFRLFTRTHLTLSKRISASSSELSSWVDLLRWRVTQQPEQRAYTFLTDGEIERDRLTYADLDMQARIIGALLQKDVKSGERALLVYPSGLEFIAAFFG